MRRTAKGFTLIELMIVLAIVAIIASIAIPSYLEQVRKSRRADASRAVGQLQLGLERWRSENPSYANCTPAPCGVGTYPTLPNTNFYTFGITGATATDYVVTATRAGPQSGDRCGNLVAQRTVSNGKPTWATTSCN